MVPNLQKRCELKSESSENVAKNRDSINKATLCRVNLCERPNIIFFYFIFSDVTYFTMLFAAGITFVYSSKLPHWKLSQFRSKFQISANSFWHSFRYFRLNHITKWERIQWPSKNFFNVSAIEIAGDQSRSDVTFMYSFSQYQWRCVVLRKRNIIVTSLLKCPLVISMITLYKTPKINTIYKLSNYEHELQVSELAYFISELQKQFTTTVPKTSATDIGTGGSFFHFNSFYPWQRSFYHLSENNSFLLNLLQRL